jgi:hypothetical protein
MGKPIEIMYLQTVTDAESLATEIQQFLTAKNFPIKNFTWFLGELPPEIDVNIHANKDTEVWITVGKNSHVTR